MAGNQKYLQLSDKLYQYLLDSNTHAKDPVLDDLREKTEEKFPEWSRMLISKEQGNLLSLLTRIMGATRVIEVGTFTGYSSICFARGLGPGGKLICCDASEEWTKLAQETWKKDGVESKIELRLGEAQETLKELPEDDPFDLVFIDADKTNYDTYYEELLPRVRPSGLIIFDNMLWGGRVIDEKDQDEDTKAIRALNQKLAKDPRVETVLLPIADGLHLCRKVI